MLCPSCLQTPAGVWWGPSYVGVRCKYHRVCQGLLTTSTWWVPAFAIDLMDTWEGHLQLKICLKLPSIHFILHCRNSGLKVPLVKQWILILCGSENFETHMKALALWKTHIRRQTLSSDRVRGFIDPLSPTMDPLE